MRTSFHHQPEAQHPKSPAIETPAGRLPHLSYRLVAPKRYKRRAVIICMRIVSSGIDSNSVANRVDASGEGFLAFWRRTIIYKNGHVRRFESEREAWGFPGTLR